MPVVPTALTSTYNWSTWKDWYSSMQLRRSKSHPRPLCFRKGTSEETKDQSPVLDSFYAKLSGLAGFSLLNASEWKADGGVYPSIGCE